MRLLLPLSLWPAEVPELLHGRVSGGAGAGENEGGGEALHTVSTGDLRC